jgi:hypothetical protein
MRGDGKCIPTVKGLVAVMPAERVNDCMVCGGGIAGLKSGLTTQDPGVSLARLITVDDCLTEILCFWRLMNSTKTKRISVEGVIVGRSYSNASADKLNIEASVLIRYSIPKE